MRGLAFILRTLLYGWLLALIELIKKILRRCRAGKRRGGESERDRRSSRVPCVPIDEPAFVRPDPLIYAQFYLMKLGLAVTWDNPDIQLRLNGAPVSSSLLKPATTYEIVARVWNNSFTAPVAAMPVHFSYLDFGAGTVSVPIGSTKIDLGVKGGPDHPAFAAVPWTTPAEPGHYCIQVLLDPPDDINSFNNLGQENTNVGEAHSPAVFTFKLRNDTARERRYRFEVDSYHLVPSGPCRERWGEEERRARLQLHARGKHPVPAGWGVSITPDAPVLAPGDEITVTASFEPPNGFAGAQDFNVNALHDDGLAGGVTLTVLAGA
ncbi:MAG TPA: hypothetical protein VD968_13275 [Pyrinomonadaceae bacterium]|nr:hypothetical protein [Pyrinomonadaceae bacterium]